MPTLNVRRINYGSPNLAEEVKALREPLTLRAEVVSPRGRQLTEKVFGEALAPARVVERICDEVRAKGLKAVLHYTEQLDQVSLDPKEVRVSAAELAAAHQAAEIGFLSALRRVRHKIMAFQLGL